jgi:HD-GYP domain-containing protein (c-di-GMP phosphodiesterase class II)
MDQVLRRLRINKEPARNRQRILETAHGLLKTQALVWVAKDPHGTVQMAGDAGLSQTECRNLATVLAKNSDLHTTGHLLCNNLESAPWATGFPAVTSLMAFAIDDAESPGLVLALNKKADSSGGAPFRRGDAALLTPFVALLRMHASATGRYQDLKDLMVGMARSLTAAIDAKDSYTYGHSERVARIAVELGRTLGLQGDELSDLYLSGLLHDVGKIGIRDSVLRKVDPLTAEEYEHIKQHVTMGYTILVDLKPIRNLLPGVLFHHERWDGKGYPEGLAGEAIPQLARILAVADAYDAMSTNRPYREALPCREVEDRLTKGAGTQWDAKVIDAFVRSRQKIHAIRQRGVGESLRTALDAALRTTDLDASVAM